MSSIFSTQKQTDSRTDIVSRIKTKLNKRQHTLIIGSFGAGKSWLLDSACAELTASSSASNSSASNNAPVGNILRLSLTLSRKAFVIAIVERMHEDGHNLDLDVDWAKADKAVRKLTVKQLIERIQPYIKQYIFIIDDLERATERTTADVVTPLLDGLVLAAADLSSQTLAKRVAPVVNHFQKIDIPPLSRTETIEMLWGLVDRTKHKRHRMLETQAWNMSLGMPGVVADIADQLGESGAIKDVRQLQHDAPGVNYVCILPTVLVLSLIALVFFRYASRGFSDPYVYVFAGSGYTIMRLMLHPITRWAEG